MTTLPQFRSDFEALDALDPLASLRDLFDVPQGVYLCGNSLGLMPKQAQQDVARVVSEWSRDAVGGWDAYQWRQRPLALGDRIGALIGAEADQTLAVDTTAINLYKVIHQALAIAGPTRKIVITERENFPADQFIVQSVARDAGAEVWVVTADEVSAKVAEAGERLAVVTLADVNYRDGSRHDMASVTSAVHAVGGLMVWDLAHSAGAVRVDVLGCGADFAVGCGYKFLNGGPGAPAFVWAHPRHIERFTEAGFPGQPLTGWLGHADPFAFGSEYEPSPGAMHYLCSSPSQLGLAALSTGVGTHEATSPFGGQDALWEKGTALTGHFMRLVADKLGDVVTSVTPSEPSRRGSQVSLACHGELVGHESRIVGALKAAGVVGDFRIGEQRDEWRTADYMRFGFAPLYLRYVDVYDAVEILCDVVKAKG